MSNPCVTRDSCSLMISESLGAVWAVESMSHPWQQFVDHFWVPRAVCAVDSMRHRWQQFVDYFWVLRAANPCVTRNSTSLVFYESLGAVWAVDSMGHRWQQFVDYFWVLRAVWAVESMRHPWQHFVSVLWVPRGCVGCRIHASHVTAVRWWFLSL
jgi:hypothetical protein